MKSNRKLARQFFLISQILLGRKNQNYKAKSYSDAALFIERSHENFLSYKSADELDRFKTIGPVIAEQILEYGKTGKILYLEDLLESTSPAKILSLAKGLGKERSQELSHLLRLKSYFDLQAAYDRGEFVKILGRDSKVLKEVTKLLEELPGWFSEKRKSLAVLGTLPSVSYLLSLDHSLRQECPYQKTPSQVKRMTTGRGIYTVFYSTSKSAQSRSAIGDWVVIKLDFQGHHLKWIALTAKYGALKGRRIIVGRESECLDHYFQSTHKTSPSLAATA